MPHPHVRLLTHRLRCPSRFFRPLHCRCHPIPARLPCSVNIKILPWPTALPTFRSGGDPTWPRLWSSHILRLFVRSLLFFSLSASFTSQCHTSPVHHPLTLNHFHDVSARLRWSTPPHLCSNNSNSLCIHTRCHRKTLQYDLRDTGFG